MAYNVEELLRERQSLIAFLGELREWCPPSDGSARYELFWGKIFDFVETRLADLNSKLLKLAAGATEAA
ncbi:MAG: hypothetical protein HY470_00550 [Candidatus Ryanbacteria bacterium]|nr:hypothetical protein [Candidatus Ryanbacteria bacterium]